MRRLSTHRDVLIRAGSKLADTIAAEAGEGDLRTVVEQTIGRCERSIDAAAMTCGLMGELEHRSDGLKLRAMLLTALLDAATGDAANGRERDDLPLCVLATGCYCAGHARGNPADEPCDTSETGEAREAGEVQS
jgi:hypothetical protein